MMKCRLIFATPVALVLAAVCFAKTPKVEPQLPGLRLRDFSQTNTILRAGRLENFTAVAENTGPQASQATLRISATDGATIIGNAVIDLGTMASGEKKTMKWVLKADAATTAEVMFRLTSASSKPVTITRPFAFFPAQDPPPAQPNFSGGAATVYYIDAVDGNNANSGLAADNAWRDFSKINNRTLRPGEKLLIRRGSVINQELVVSARGTADRWVEIGAYGTGPRPIIRRNWDIGDRCAFIHNPDFLYIRSLVVSYAGKGLIVYYNQPDHTGLIVEDCIAHHIEGMYRENAHGIPEWFNRTTDDGDQMEVSAGIAINGRAKNIVLRNCETFQCSSGFVVKDVEAATVDRVFCHDNYVRNTSPHPFLVNVYRSYLVNSVFDAAGWHASAGTMGIMFMNPQGLISRNCIFRNQPDSGSADQGGIDFENLGNGTLVDHCQFINNSGSAIEILGLKKPQARNIEIMNSRFILNNKDLKHGPSEIYVWGKAKPPDPEVCCSTGLVHDNGYVLIPGVEFFKNEAPKTTSWTLKNNTGYKSVEEIDRAMPFNMPPVVDAGADMCTNEPRVRLAGNVRDDGRTGKSPVLTWEVLEGPAVAFQNKHALDSLADFPAPGDYILRLVADDGEFWSSRMLAVHILPAGKSAVRTWEFNRPLDKEGWIEVNPGTQFRQFKELKKPTRSQPVKYVAGGYFILAIENSPDAQLLSPDNLDIDAGSAKTCRIRFQNHTPAREMRLRFTTDSDDAWDDGKSKSFAVVPNDNGPRQYAVDMSDVPGWAGRLKQIRLDISTGLPLTGTCRFDYIWIDDSRE
jgi:hypothetical protein